jgi:LytS/YehU family sensor histidine kinase
MNPHFVGNTISAVQSLILQEKKEDALHYLNDFSKLTRHALENSRKDSITLNDEITFLTHYFHLEQLRSPAKFDYNIIVDQSIDDVTYVRIPPMMVQPFAENAIRHGLYNKQERGLVTVLFKLVDRTLICSIEDNGVGREAAARIEQQQRKSQAISITDARLELLQKKADIQHKYKIQIDDLINETGVAAGTKVTIAIPTSEPAIIAG